MNLRKAFWVELLVITLALSFAGPAFSQGRPGKVISQAGKIEWVSRDFKSIGIHESKVLITPETKIVDKQGKSLRLSELKQGRHVVVEMIRKSDGSRERRVVVLN